jgi:hypothetical protein
MATGAHLRLEEVERRQAAARKCFFVGNPAVGLATPRSLSRLPFDSAADLTSPSPRARSQCLGRPGFVPVRRDHFHVRENPTQADARHYRGLVRMPLHDPGRFTAAVGTLQQRLAMS